MGAERWLLFRNKTEAERAKAFLAPLKEEVAVETEGCWLHWPSPCKLEVGYSFGGEGEVIATFACREIARRFKISRVGSDSTGWYDNKNWMNSSRKGPTARYGTYSSWVDWMKDYKPEWDWEYQSEKDQERLDQVKTFGIAVADLFQELEPIQHE